MMRDAGKRGMRSSREREIERETARVYSGVVADDGTTTTILEGTRKAKRGSGSDWLYAAFFRPPRTRDDAAAEPE